MSFRDQLTVTNIVFVIGGIYFAALGLSGEATIYSILPAILCFVAVALSFREDLYFAGPWRVAAAVSVLVLLAGQEVASFSSSNLTSSYLLITIVLNGVFFVLFLGVLLSCAREVTKLKKQEEEEEEEESALEQARV